MNAKVPLKVGDAITYEGYGCRVTRAEPGYARVLNEGGNSFVVENPIPEVYVEAPHGAVRPLQDLLAAFAAWREEFEKPISEKEKKSMSKNATSSKPAPRGGLAAVDKEIKAEQKCTDVEHCPKPKHERKAKTPESVKAFMDTKSHSSGRLGQLFGSSVVRVVMTLAKKGATFDQIVAGLKKHKINPAASTIKQNMRLGVANVPGAELTKEQLEEFGL